MNIPESVKVAGYNYKVIRTEGSFPNGDQVCDGISSFVDHTIKVADNGDNNYQETVFLHELIHAIIACYCTNLDDEEEFTNTLSIGLYQVMQDNP